MAFAPLAYLPRSAWHILREMTRHLLRHPVVGVMAAARDADGRWLLVRRADTGTWAMPGGTVDWGETLSATLVREVAEETGARVERVGRVIGVYSRPDRDMRFHAITVLVHVLVNAERLGPANPLEVREVRLFTDQELPAELAMDGQDMLRDARKPGVDVVLE
ncbi:MAG: NUDIX hydrolase [Polyangiaceae bacterium]|jgi:8-oxo-dGTP diphosphatase|nr:NUDIX hydrolase [Polyangiaceae bacterium]